MSPETLNLESNSRLANLAGRMRARPVDTAREMVNRAAMRMFSRPLQLAIIVEYPKSGGTWLRRQIDCYRGVATISEHGRLVSRRSAFTVHGLPARHLRKPIVLVRDPRDVLVSYFHYETRLLPKASGRHESDSPSEGEELKQEFLEYVRWRYRARPFPRFTMSEFVAAWSREKGCLWIRYEDMLANPEMELARCVTFLGDTFDAARVSEAVSANTFSATVDRESAALSSEGVVFARKGVAGEWRKHVNRECAELIWAQEGYALRKLGYAGDNSWISEVAR